MYQSTSLSLVPGASSNPCDDDYRGTQPFSEVEVRNVANYLKNLKRRGQIAGYMDIHSYSQLWMTPWGYTRQRPRDHGELVRKMRITCQIKWHFSNGFWLGNFPKMNRLGDIFCLKYQSFSWFCLGKYCLANYLTIDSNLSIQVVNGILRIPSWGGNGPSVKVSNVPLPTIWTDKTTPDGRKLLIYYQL